MTQPGVVTDPEFTIGDRLRKAREITGLDQGQFAVEIGVSRNTVGAAEKADSPPRKIMLRAWALRAGVSVEWLQTGQSSAPTSPDGGLSNSDWTSGRIGVLRLTRRMNQTSDHRLDRLAVAA